LFPAGGFGSTESTKASQHATIHFLHQFFAETSAES